MKDFNMYGDEAPINREQCKGNERPCPWVRCKMHLVFDTFPKLKSITDEQIVDKLLTIPETCCLDVVDSGGKTLREVGKIMGVTRERVRQIEGLSTKDYILKGISRLRDSPKRMRELKELCNYEN